MPPTAVRLSEQRPAAYSEQGRARGCAFRPIAVEVWRCHVVPSSGLEELQNFVNKVFVVLEDAAVSGVVIDSELGVWEALGQVE